MTGAPNPRFRCKVSQSLPAAATDAVVTLAAVAGERHVISQIDYGYGVAAPAAPRLTVSGLNDDGLLTYDIDLPAAVGSGQLAFAEFLIGKLGGAVVVTLASGGGTSVGKLNVVHAQ